MLVENGMLGRVHAADPGAVGEVILRIPGAHAGDEHDILRHPSVGGTDEPALGGAGGGEQPLEGDAVDHILAVAQTVLFYIFLVVQVEAGGDHDGPDLEILEPVFLLEIHSAEGASLFTNPAATFSEVQAVLRVDDHLVGNRLGKGGVDGLAIVQEHVELGLHLGGAFFRAHAAARALVPIHVGRLVADLDGEVAHVAGDLLHLAVGAQADVPVLPHLHHPGREDTLGAVQGGKGL